VTKHGAVLAKQMALPLPWDAVLLPVSAFPIPKEELAGVATFVRKLGANVAGAQRLSSETFIQVEQSDDIECRRMYSQRAREWIPEVGLGVWPDREPPVAWTQEEFMSLLPGMKPRRLMHQVLRILQKATALLLPPIKDPSFNCYPFYVPLLDEKGLTSATEEQLEAWFCGASVYIRESFEDKGILIASRQPLKAIMVKLGGRFEPGEIPTWSVPD
jgi:hypothetical protein